MVAPPAEVFDRVKFGTPNYSLRMSDLAAACVRPQASLTLTLNLTLP